MLRQIKITFSLSAELKQQILNYCKEKSKDGITFTPSDLCRIAAIEYMKNHPIDKQYWIMQYMK